MVKVITLACALLRLIFKVMIYNNYEKEKQLRDLPMKYEPYHEKICFMQCKLTTKAQISIFVFHSVGSIMEISP